jgi:dihydroxy-acid dehydratase
MSMLKSGLRSRDILTRKAIENAIVVVYSLGGSTNAFLHILAIAHEAEVPLTIAEIGEIGKPVPLLGNMRPHGHFHMSDLSKIGGVPIVMKELLTAGMLHGAEHNTTRGLVFGGAIFNVAEQRSFVKTDSGQMPGKN